MCVYRCYPLVIEHRHIPMEIISSRSIPKVQELLDEETVVQLFRFLLHPDGRAEGVVRWCLETRVSKEFFGILQNVVKSG